MTAALLGSVKTACSMGTFTLPDNWAELDGFEAPAWTVRVTGVGVLVGVFTEVLVAVTVFVAVLVAVLVKVEVIVSVAVLGSVGVGVAV